MWIIADYIVDHPKLFWTVMTLLIVGSIVSPFIFYFGCSGSGASSEFCLALTVIISS